MFPITSKPLAAGSIDKKKHRLTTIEFATSYSNVPVKIVRPLSFWLAWWGGRK